MTDKPQSNAPVASGQDADWDIIAEFLHADGWGRCRYMEGSDIYAERDKARDALDRLRNAANVPKSR